MLRELRFATAQTALKGKRFDEILAHLESATLKHTDGRTLGACAETWRALLGQGGAPALQEAVQLRHRRLVTRLVQGLKPLASARAQLAARTLEQLSRHSRPPTRVQSASI